MIETASDAIRDGWGDEDFFGAHPAANYTLAVVYRDGNPIDVENFGTDKHAALARLREERDAGDAFREHWVVYDSDDPERGYFDPSPGDPNCAGGDNDATPVPQAASKATPLASPPVQQKLTPMTVLSYTPSQYHCREGMAWVNECGVAVDTYWEPEGDHNSRRLTEQEIALATVEFNAAEFDALDRYATGSRGKWETYHP